MVIFHSYVSLPEGKPPFSYGFFYVFPFSYGFCQWIALKPMFFRVSGFRRGLSLVGQRSPICWAMFIDSMGISPPFIWPELWYVYVKLYLHFRILEISHWPLLFIDVHEKYPPVHQFDILYNSKINRAAPSCYPKGSDAHRQGVLQLIRMKGADAELNYFLMDHISTNESRSVYPLEI